MTESWSENVEDFDDEDNQQDQQDQAEDSSQEDAPQQVQPQPTTVSPTQEVDPRSISTKQRKSAYNVVAGEPVKHDQQNNEG